MIVTVIQFENFEFLTLSAAPNDVAKLIYNLDNNVEIKDSQHGGKCHKE